MEGRRRRVGTGALLAVLTLCIASPARAEIIGLVNPLVLPSITQNSRLIYGPGGINVTDNPILFDGSATFGGIATAEITGSTFKGSIDAPNTAAGSFVQAGSFFRDQLQITSQDGSPVVPFFDFLIDYELSLSGGFGQFYLAMDNTWATEADPTIPRQLYSEHGVDLQAGSHSLSFTLALNDFDPTVALGSGLFLPFSLGIHGRAAEATLDWSHTIQFAGLRVFDQAGNQLAPGQFTASFVSGRAVPGDPVPEPGTLALLTAGFALPAWRRLRRK